MKKETGEMGGGLLTTSGRLGANDKTQEKTISSISLVERYFGVPSAKR